MNKIGLCQKALDFKAISDLSDLPKVEYVCVSVKAGKLEVLLLYVCTVAHRSDQQYYKI